MSHLWRLTEAVWPDLRLHTARDNMFARIAHSVSEATRWSNDAYSVQEARLAEAPAELLPHTRRHTSASLSGSLR